MLACSLGVHLRATPSWTSSTVLSEEESTASSRGSRHAPSRCRHSSREGPVGHAGAPDASPPRRRTPPGGGCVPRARADFAHDPLGSPPWRLIGHQPDQGGPGCSASAPDALPGGFWRRTRHVYSPPRPQSDLPESRPDPLRARHRGECRSAIRFSRAASRAF